MCAWIRANGPSPMSCILVLVAQVWNQTFSVWMKIKIASCISSLLKRQKSKQKSQCQSTQVSQSMKLTWCCDIVVQNELIRELYNSRNIYYCYILLSGLELHNAGHNIEKSHLLWLQKSNMFTSQSPFPDSSLEFFFSQIHREMCIIALIRIQRKHIQSPPPHTHPPTHPWLEFRYQFSGFEGKSIIVQGCNQKGL